MSAADQQGHPEQAPVHAGWRSRGYLPHFDSPETVQHIVFRLADALPAAMAFALAHATPMARARMTLEALTSGHGERLLADPRVAGIMEEALLHFDERRYRLLAWCVMPSHVHVLVEQSEGRPLSTVVHGWKSVTANRATKVLRRAGRLWAPEYYDRYMRNEVQLETTRAYVERNSVSAGLCAQPEDWRFSSARTR